MSGCWLYILQCSDGSYYVGTTRHDDPDTRLAEHNAAHSPVAYTAYRRPVRLVFASWFGEIVDAIAMERQVKGWRRAKKEALIAGRHDLLPDLARGRRARGHGASFDSRPAGRGSG